MDYAHFVEIRKIVLKMLSPKLINCSECSNISVLLSDIDNALTNYAFKLYNNTIFALNKNINKEALSDLIQYKRILTYKICNPDYASPYSIQMIASRIKLLINK